MVVWHNKIGPPLFSSFKLVYAIWSGPYKAECSKCLAIYSNWAESLMDIGLLGRRVALERNSGG